MMYFRNEPYSPLSLEWAVGTCFPVIGLFISSRIPKKKLHTRGVSNQVFWGQRPSFFTRFKLINLATTLKTNVHIGLVDFVDINSVLNKCAPSFFEIFATSISFLCLASWDCRHFKIWRAWLCLDQLEGPYSYYITQSAKDTCRVDVKSMIYIHLLTKRKSDLLGCRKSPRWTLTSAVIVFMQFVIC